MQSAVNCLRTRHRSSTVLTALVRLTDPAAPGGSCAHSDQVGWSLCLDQRIAQDLAKENLRLRLVSHNSARHTCDLARGKQFSSSAEFSGGSFNVSSSASLGEDRQDDRADDDIDDKVMLLEASLNFVVSSFLT